MQPRGGCLLLSVLLAALGVLWRAAEAQQAPAPGASACSVDARTTLAECLESPAREIVLLGDHDVGASLARYGEHQLALDRNVTIRGRPGLAPDAWPVLNLQFADSVIRLCGTCTLRFENVVLRNERRGSGLSYDAFTASRGGKVQCRNVYRLRAACTPPADALALIHSRRRSALLPNSSAPQQAELRDVVYKGKVFPRSVVVDDLTLDEPLTFQEGRGEAGVSGGYAQSCHGVTRLCEAYVSLECLLTNSPDVCVSAFIDARGAAGQGTPSAAVGAAIAVPVTVVVLMALAGGVYAYRRARRSCEAAAAPPKHSGTTKRGPPHGGAGGAEGTPSSDADATSHRTRSSMQGPRLSRPLANSRNWEVLGTMTSPLLGDVEEGGGIELGDLLGTGSYGRVFKGIWAGRAVAVKVIEHTGDSVDAVRNEVETLMSFDHDNIIKAYHCITYMHSAGGNASESSGSAILLRNDSLQQTQGSMHGGTATPASSCTPSGIGGARAQLMCCSPADGCCSEASTQLQAIARLRRQDSAQGQDGAGPPLPPPLQPADSGGALVVLPGPPPTLRDIGHTHSATTTRTAGSMGPEDSLESSVDCRCQTCGPAMLRASFKEVPRRSESWLVLELCDLGNLAAYAGSFPAPAECGGCCDASMLRVLRLLRDAALGLKELHGRHVVHGDLNMHNILVSSCAGAELGVRAKLADLGLARTIRQFRSHATTNTVGTLNHSPPEMLRSGHVSQAVDIYALGIAMWEIYSGQEAFRGLQHPGAFYETVVLQDLRPVVPPGMPADYQLLMQHCWATDPEARPGINRVLECLEYMIQDREQRMEAAAAAAEGRVGAATHVRSAPLPFLLMSPPPRKPAWWQQRRQLATLTSLGRDSHGSESTGTCSSPSRSSSVGFTSFDAPAAVTAAAASAGAQRFAPRSAAAAAAAAADAQQHSSLSVPLPGASQPSRVLTAGRGAPHPVQQLLQLQACDSPRRCSDDVLGVAPSGSSAGSTRHWLQGIRASIQQTSFSLRDLSFSSRGTSWSAQQNSVTSVQEHAWFV